MNAAVDTNVAMELADVSFAYPGGEPVVREVTAAVGAGTLHVILGPNAAGKSTLLRLMLGQLRPMSGRITLDGRRVHRIAPKRRAAMLAYVPQRSTVSFGFTVRQIIAMGRFALPANPQAIGNAIERCDLTALVDRPFPELSVGQQQRVLLARAIAQSSSLAESTTSGGGTSRGGGRVVLLDEPVSAMDLAHAHRVMTTLREMVAGGLAGVVVLHDLNLAAMYADVVWLMHEGRLVKAGDWSEVLRPEVLEPIYGVRIDELRRAVDPGDPLSRRPVFDVRLPDAFDRR